MQRTTGSPGRSAAPPTTLSLRFVGPSGDDQRVEAHSAQPRAGSGDGRDTESVGERWVHIGRLWTNGDPFLAVDAALRSAWHGFSDDRYDEVVDLGLPDTSLAVGTGRAAVVGADGVVRDDSWMEVFEAEGGVIAVVQASGPDYAHILAEALRYPIVDDDNADVLVVPSGELALFSAANDGDGQYSDPFVGARPGSVPATHGPPSRAVDPGLLLTANHTAYHLKVRCYTELDEQRCFARWLLLPVATDQLH